MNKVFVLECPACLSRQLVPFLKVTDDRASKEIFELYRCVQCGLVLTQNHPAEAEIGRYYDTDDYISHSDKGTSIFERVYFFVRSRMARKKQALIERYTQGKKLIDIGAGTGFFLAHMQKRGWAVTGIEPNAHAREVALQSHGLKLAEPNELFALPALSADIITMWHVLEHVHRPEYYLKRIHEILNDRGALFLALPNHQSFDASFYGLHWAAWDVPRHLWHFSPQAVKTMLQRAGFSLIHQYVLPFDAFYVALISEKYRGGGLLRMIRGLTIGKLSYFRALFNKEKASSVVYIFRKKESSYLRK